MAQASLILDRYEPIGTAGAGGFGTVQIAWDPRIQRKVAIKTIKLSEHDAFRASLPGAEAVAKDSRASAPAEDPEPARVEDPKNVGLLPVVDPSPKLTPGDIPAIRSVPKLDPDAVPSVRAVPSLEIEPVLTTDAHDGQGRFAGAADAADDDTIDEPRSFQEVQPWSENASWPELEPVAPGAPALDEPVRHAQQVTALAHLPGLDEARTAAKLSDSRIAAVYDFEVRDQTAYLIMEYVEGITLTELLYDYPEYLTLDVLACVFDAVAGALVVAHKAGVLHLDIKPDNIIINADGQAKVTDFGLATLADASGKGTTGGGTIGYMPLEQMRREHLDVRTDEWSLAAMTYEMLTGDNPFRASSLEEAERAILDAELVLPSLCWETIDEQIDDVIFYALDPDREQRYDTVEDFAEEVDKFLGNATRGKRQLSLVVQDALDEALADEAQDDDAASFGESAHEDAGNELAKTRLQGAGSWLSGLFGRRRKDSQRAFKQASPESGADAPERAYDGYSEYPDYPAAEEPDDDGYAPYDYFDYEQTDQLQEAGKTRKHKRERTAREPFTSLSKRVPASVVESLSRAFTSASSAFVAYLALANVGLLSSSFGGNALFIVLAVAVVTGVLGAILPTFGALAAYCLLGVSIMLCGHPLVGGVLVTTAVLWCYIAGREGVANPNVALLGPLAGSVGGACATPIFGGASLKPIEAVVTVAFSLVVAAVFASFGSMSLVGWDAFAHWNFMSADITRNMMNLLAMPTTWASAAGWMAGALAFSLLRASQTRWGFLLGMVVAVLVVGAGAVAFATPAPQVFITLAITVVALLLAV